MDNDKILKNFQTLVNKFLCDTEKTDKGKPIWQTKNHIYILHQSIHEFYIWLTKNLKND